jgi:hypothetical protein
MFVMLLLSVITQIPELNMSKLFSLDSKNSNDPERQLLAGGGGGGLGGGGGVIASSVNTSNSPKYSRQVDEDDTSSLSHVNRATAFEEQSLSQ